MWDSSDLPHNHQLPLRTLKVNLRGSGVRLSDAILKEGSGPCLDNGETKLVRRIEIGPQGWL